MFFITGDTHGWFSRFKEAWFPEQKHMTKQDYVIICGDFGLWDDSTDQNHWLDWLEQKPYTTLFVSGNHDNYDMLKTITVTKFCDGNAQFIRPSVIHLMRGQVFTIDGKRFFTMGGASCHDINDGILSMDDPDFEEKKKTLDEKGGMYRIEHLSWWKEELPCEEDYKTAWENLEKVGYEVDHIITHCPPDSILRLLWLMGAKGYKSDTLTEFLEQVKEKVKYKSWYFGHYHRDEQIIDNHYVMYEEIVPLENEVQDV